MICAECGKEIPSEEQVDIEEFKDLCHPCYTLKPKHVCVDFDGVLAEYTGWKGPEHLGEPMPGAKEFLQGILDLGMKTIVLTTGNPPWCTLGFFDNEMTSPGGPGDPGEAAGAGLPRRPGSVFPRRFQLCPEGDQAVQAVLEKWSGRLIMRKSFFPPVEELVRWAARMARLTMKPKTIRISRTLGGNKNQENARRRLRQKIYGTATGGGPIWPR